jgi:transcriptional regulator with XRE-family HTH domain
LEIDEMDKNEITRERIFALVERKGVMDSDFAIGIGVSKFVVSHWRCGTSTSFIKYLPDIASYFHVSIDYLTGRENDSKDNDILSSIKDRSELRELFQAAKDASKEEVENAIKIMEALKKD